MCNMSCVMQDLPYDSTGELKRVRAFIEDNMDTCKWVALGVIIIQVSSVFHHVYFTVIFPFLPWLKVFISFVLIVTYPFIVCRGSYCHWITFI